MPVFSVLMHDPVFLVLGFLLLASVGVLLYVHPRRPNRVLKKAEMDFISGSKKVSVVVEVAETFRQKQVGLMFRKALGAEEGMFFPYRRPTPVVMWMKNMNFGIDVVYMDASSKVVRVDSLKPGPRSASVSKILCSAVVELPYGFCASHGIGKGWLFLKKKIRSSDVAGGISL